MSEIYFRLFLSRQFVTNCHVEHFLFFWGLGWGVGVILFLGLLAPIENPIGASATGGPLGSLENRRWVSIL